MGSNRSARSIQPNDYFSGDSNDADTIPNDIEEGLIQGQVQRQ